MMRRVYSLKPCARCGVVIRPTSGRQKWCVGCFVLVRRAYFARYAMTIRKARTGRADGRRPARRRRTTAAVMSPDFLIALRTFGSANG